jgi:hypothetical protein
MTGVAALAVLSFVVAPPVRPDDGCPSARQVTDALTARIPESLVPPPAPRQPVRADLLRAVVDAGADGAAVTFLLIDGRGEVRLRRVLGAPGRGKPGECAALADTMAVIVERFLSGISYEPPVEPPAPPAPPPPPPPSEPSPPPPATRESEQSEQSEQEQQGAKAPAEAPVTVERRQESPLGDEPRALLLGLGAGWRAPSSASSPIEARLSLAVEVTRTEPRLMVYASAGASGAVEWTLDQGTATLRRFPLTVGLALAFAAGPGRIEPALAVSLDLLSVSATGAAPQDPVRRYLRYDAEIQIALGYRVHLGPMFLRFSATGGFAMMRHEVLAGDAPETLFGTPKLYMIGGLEGGVVFR